MKENNKDAIISLEIEELEEKTAPILSLSFGASNRG